MCYRIDQAKINKDTGEVNMVEIGKYNPEATVVLQMFEDPEFYGGLNEFPSCIRKDKKKDCPFSKS